jgi:hypothetical protein
MTLIKFRTSNSVAFIIGPQSEAMLEIRNVSTETIEVSVSSTFHELRVDIPDTTE